MNLPNIIKPYNKSKNKHFKPTTQQFIQLSNCWTSKEYQQQQPLHKLIIEEDIFRSCSLDEIHDSHMS